jgi:hypothetical protein
VSGFVAEVQAIWTEFQAGTLAEDDAVLHLRAVADLTDFGAREILANSHSPAERYGAIS